MNRLIADRHQVHLLASRWDAQRLPAAVQVHPLPAPRGPRFLRPWQFGSSCLAALGQITHDVSVGFDKTWGQDVLYPQGGLHAASAAHNWRKYSSRPVRWAARAVKWFDVAHWSFTALERRQYRGAQPPLIVVNSDLVRHHFQKYLGISAADLRVIRSAIDPGRFAEVDRLRRRAEWREEWDLSSVDTVGLFVAMNYRLKGLAPLLHAVALLPAEPRFRLLVAGNPRFGKYERLARRLGIADRVRFLGPRRDVQHCYFAADMLIHPTFYDPCSLVVLEALACGLPVITSRFNGASELLTPPREGYVIADPNDRARLAQCITQLLDSSRRNACAQAARATASRWTFEQHYQQLLGVFREAWARKSAA